MVAYTADGEAGIATIRVRRGNDYGRVLQIRYKPEQKPIDLTGYELSAVVTLWGKREIVATFAVTIVDAKDGTIYIELTEEQTAAMAAGSYRWRLSWTDPKSYARAVVRGVLEVTEEWL
jgi:hypothetical protein